MITDLKMSIGAENKDGDVVCVLKFKVPCKSPDLDQLYWFHKNHDESYDLAISDGIFAMTESSRVLAPGQTTLDFSEDPEDEGTGKGALIVLDEDGVGHLAATFGDDDQDEEDDDDDVL